MRLPQAILVAFERSEKRLDEHVGRLERVRVEPAPAQRREIAPATRARRPKLGWLFGLLVLVAGAGAALWLHPWAGMQRGRGRLGDAPQAVRTASATTGDMPLIDSELGTVTPLATVTVKTQINGQLQQVAFTEGQQVKRGDFLAQIDPRPYQIALEQAQGQLAKDQGLLAQARADLVRFQTLNRQDSISRQQVEDQVFLVQEDQGMVMADQGTVDSAKLNIAYCHIVSPVDGQVGLRQVDQGNYVQTSDTSGLVVITELQPISVIFTMPEDDLPKVLARLKAGASLPVTAFDRSNTTQLATGTLMTTDNEVDTATGTVKLRAIFPNTDESLFPSQFVNARLLVDALHNVVIVPTAAIQSGAPGTYVYVVDAENTVSVRPVVVGPADGERTAVTSGLKLGENVVIDGADRLRAGAKVAVNNTPAAADAATPVPAGRRRGPGQHQGEGNGQHRRPPQQQSD
jgi:multidrug efflux system membrane fusion protein